ncbi:MAG: M36 family metallopeptidase, partial [Acidobacteriota bacterium]
NCNANFGTPPDGSNPRMQMFTCTNANPARDGDYDNGVIVHEYGHGISTRQVGGPGNSSCLGNTQQAGEGWSDWLALAYTAEPGDTGAQARGLGAYLFNTTTTIRDLPYSTSNSVNNWTYESINGASVPHGVGSRWAQAAWEVYWKLVDKWGFEADLVNFNINDANEAGNKRAMFYVNEGLKNTACSPTFVDNRDGIIQAATDNFGGVDVCDIWEAFADFGLGTNAISGGSNSRNPTNGFSIPSACSGGGGGGGGGGGTGTCDGTNCIDWDNVPTESYGGQDNSSQVSVSNGGDTITLTANTWRRTTSSTTFNVTANTVVEFDFSSTSQGEIHGLGFDEDNGLSSNRIFKVHGTQNWGITDFDNYTSGTVSYSIPVGQFYTGNNMRLVLVNDKDSGTLNNNSIFTNVRVFESGGGGGTCSYDNDFEGGDTAGWSNAGNCSTGAYVIANPTAQSSGGVTTQPNGSASGSNSLFTATNSSAGNADVDGGTCILNFSGANASSGSTLSFNYFHGQRDGGDDSGDFFNVQYRVNGGSWQTVVSNGDTVSTASWTAASTAVPAGNVELRVQCADAPNGGDIIECGIDDVKICN